MVNIQVRDVPAELRDMLAAEAEDRGQSMQVFLMTVLEEIGRKRRSIAMLRQLDAMGGGYTGPGSDAAEEIAELRAERDRRNMGDA